MATKMERMTLTYLLCDKPRSGFDGVIADLQRKVNKPDKNSGKRHDAQGRQVEIIFPDGHAEIFRSVLQAANSVGVSSETLFRRIDEGLIERGKLKGYEARRVVDDEHSDKV